MNSHSYFESYIITPINRNPQFIHGLVQKSVRTSSHMFKFNGRWLLPLLGWLLRSSFAQELNVLPNIVRPYFFHVEQNFAINLMANVSEKLFHLQKWGHNFKFGAKSQMDFIVNYPNL